MIRRLYFISSIASLLLIGILAFFWPPVLYFLIVVAPLIILGLFDLRSTHNVLRIYPVIGHLRYMFEFIRPEIQQYFVATNVSGRPYNRELRTLVYQRAENAEDTHPFGTEHDILNPGYEFTRHAMLVKQVPDNAGRVTVGGPECKQPYNASRINVSAMSFGAISANAVLAINLGAKLGNFAQNTGEGSLSSHHLKEGGDIIWQIASGYFGCRTLDGDFDEHVFKEKANIPSVKMIEIKLSQGAKPSHGGVLPATKITPEIAEIRGVPMGKDCMSPASHKTFSTPEGLMQFVQKLRELSDGKPIGFKLCIGKPSDFMGICKAMIKTGIKPDFITVDGAEGGTGAAPLEYTNRFGLPINEGLAFVHNVLVGANLRDEIKIIASGKVATGFDMVMKKALGADMCNLARPFMFSIGCIQALKCNTNLCPTGVTSQDPKRYQAIVPKHKAEHVRHYHHNTMKSFLDMVGAMGYEHPDELHPGAIRYRIHEGNSVPFSDLFDYLEPGNLLSKDIHPRYKVYWENSAAEQFYDHVDFE